MLKLKKVAITGGLSCGKTLVCRIFQELGAYVVSADAIVHDQLSSNASVAQKLIKLLGPEILIDDKIDRSKIAQIIFHHRFLKKSVENLLHPIVYGEIERKYQQQCVFEPRPSLFIAEIPLLFETREEKQFDYTVAVIANQEECLKRFEQLNRYDREEFYQRMNQQYSLEKKALLADFVISNEGNFKDLKEKVEKLHKMLIQN